MIKYNENRSRKKPYKTLNLFLSIPTVIDAPIYDPGMAPRDKHNVSNQFIWLSKPCTAMAGREPMRAMLKDVAIALFIFIPKNTRRGDISMPPALASIPETNPTRNHINFSLAKLILEEPFSLFLKIRRRDM